MRRKRLNHIAFTLCHMFCGWQGYFDYPDLVKLGDGELEIDVLINKCYFNKKEIKNLKIAGALCSFLKEECNANNIDINLIKKATLQVKIQFSTIDWAERKHSLNEQFFNKSGQIRGKKMHKCTVECTGIIDTDENNYIKEYKEIKEWPEGWPENKNT